MARYYMIREIFSCKFVNLFDVIRFLCLYLLLIMNSNYNSIVYYTFKIFTYINIFYFFIFSGVRDTIGAKQAVNEFLKSKNIQGNVVYEKLDIGLMSSVRDFAKAIKNKYGKIDLLINNGKLIVIILTNFKFLLFIN